MRNTILFFLTILLAFILLDQLRFNGGSDVQLKQTAFKH